MSGTLLIADDEAPLRLVLRVLFERAGYTVRTASDGAAALAEMRRAPPDLVLLDIAMPACNGYAVCQAARADPALALVPIVVLTARTHDVERAKALALGASAWVSKPFSTRALLDTVRRCIAATGRAPLPGCEASPSSPPSLLSPPPDHPAAPRPAALAGASPGASSGATPGR